jgi:hypothetical protein
MFHDEDSYINNFHLSEDIELDRDAIRSNPAKLGLAKLYLNSMCGKLSERNNRTKTKKISEPQDLYRLLGTPGIEGMNFIFASD